MIHLWRHVLGAVLIAGTCHAAAGTLIVPAAAAPVAADLVVRGGQLLDMVADEPKVRPIKGLVVRDGKIERIIEAGSKEPLPDAARVIDGAKFYILPGLVDSHIHFREWFPKPFIHFGVTTLMDTAPCPDCSKDPEEDPNEWILRYKKALQDSGDSAPALFVTGMKLDGPRGKKEPNVYLIQDESEIPGRVKHLAELGASGIKVEEGLPPAFRKRVIEEADKLNLPVVGHSREARESIAAGMIFIEHMLPIARSLSPDESKAAEHTMDLAKAPELIQLMISKRVYLNPTLTARYGPLSKRAKSFAQEDVALLDQPVFADIPASMRAELASAFLRADRMPPQERQQAEEGFRKVQDFVREFSARGGMVLSGTDSVGGRVPGISMQRELQLLVDAGVPPYKALLGATRWASDLMRMSNTIGTLQPGKQADILILGSDPLTDIAATKDVRYVIRRGTVVRAPRD